MPPKYHSRTIQRNRTLEISLPEVLSSAARFVSYMLSPICVSVGLWSVCNARAPYSDGCNFRQYYYLLNTRSVQHTETDNEQYIKTHKTIK